MVVIIIKLTHFSSFSIGNIMPTFPQSLLHVSASKEGNANKHHNGGDSTNNTTNLRLNNYHKYSQLFAFMFLTKLITPSTMVPVFRSKHMQAFSTVGIVRPIVD